MLLTLSTFLLGLTLSCLQTIQADETENPFRKLAPYNADYAFDLFKHLVKLDPQNDVLISPISISMATAMLSLSANNQTRIQMLKGLGFNLSQTSETDIDKSFQKLHELFSRSDKILGMSMGNTLFHDENRYMEELISEKARQYYGLEHLGVDFQNWGKVCNQINEYMNNKSQGITSDFSLESTRMVSFILMNYFFFSGTWAEAFNPENTMEEDFFVDNETVVKVPMMFQSSLATFLHDTELHCMVIKMEYVSDRAAFFILPDDGDINTIIQALSRDTLYNWDMSLSTRNLDLYIPKISLTGSYDLMEILRIMDIVDIKKDSKNFCDNCDFQVPLSELNHYTKVKFSEEGKVPAVPQVFTPAVTGKFPPIRFNRPYVVMIFDHSSWSSLFLGKVVNPKKHINVTKCPESH
ncbi:corticosteroid-binding globulin-like [Suncus etruscus]|uniref:corticosteroid-binding globulin-like n=1 Tax=Suncus etruscus TaxID=109475 RepID=UPI00210F7C8E|nr:corticosteroid-binding globulin-like [Suncus etruscus]